MIKLNDNEIDQLISEKKTLTGNYKSLLRLKPKRGHKERELDIIGIEGHEFRVILRQSEFNILDFSVILTYRPPGSNELFTLRRYNGRSHEHTNSIEKQTFYSFHIHRATERYQELGSKEATYAEPCNNKYNSIDGAITCMFEECGFEIPPETSSSQGKFQM
jgi:hypothetical protein